MKSTGVVRIELPVNHLRAGDAVDFFLNGVGLERCEDEKSRNNPRRIAAFCGSHGGTKFILISDEGVNHPGEGSCISIKVESWRMLNRAMEKIRSWKQQDKLPNNFTMFPHKNDVYISVPDILKFHLVLEV